MAIPSSEAVERIMDDSDYNSSGGSSSDEQEEFQMSSFSALDMLDVAQVFFRAILLHFLLYIPQLMGIKNTMNSPLFFPF